MSAATTQKVATVGEALANARQLLQTHPDAAARQAQSIIQAEPRIAESFFILATALRRQGRFDDANLAEQKGIAISMSDRVLSRAADLLSYGRTADAEELLRHYLKDTPNDPVALTLLAEVISASGQLGSAEQLLWQALVLAPSFARARDQFERVITAQSRAIPPVEDNPSDPPEGEQEFGEAIQLNEHATKNQPQNAKLWLGYGHALRLAGRQEDSIAAYRQAIKLMPGYGEAWWSLADLKTSLLDEHDQGVMLAQLGSGKLSELHQTGIHFALGKGLADASEHEQAFFHYAAGNALKRKTILYNVADTIDHVDQCKASFPEAYFSSRIGDGYESDDPIFIIGMPRSGSTLVEQILASHPSVEGTEELAYFGNLANFISHGRRAGLDPSEFVEVAANLPPERLRAIGGAYLWHANRHRRSSRPHFIDKMPRNWLYLPLIRLALPNARIIDVRRDAMDCCWSNFRQLFADGSEYSYELTELGQYYRAYVDMIDHFDAVDPGAIHRVQYEQLVGDPDGEIRRLLSYLDLPFDPACLDFHRNPRAVKTASSEQVRQPINRRGLGQWKPYEQWLGPLKLALSPKVD